MSISFNDHTLFHLLRHFEAINIGARDCLLNRGYKRQAIEAALTMPGSRFRADFAQDLKSLEQQLGKGQIISQEKVGQYLQLQYQFSQEAFPLGIGYLGVIPLADLATYGARELTRKTNRGLQLLHAKLPAFPKSWQISVVLKPQKNYQLLITAFPGNWALPIPKTNMSEQDFKLSSAFWEQHVFLELAK